MLIANYSSSIYREEMITINKKSYIKKCKGDELVYADATPFIRAVS